MIKRIYCPVCGNVHFLPMCSQESAVVNPGGVGAPNFNLLNPIHSESSEDPFKCPICGNFKLSSEDTCFMDSCKDKYKNKKKWECPICGNFKLPSEDTCSSSSCKYKWYSK